MLKNQKYFSVLIRGSQLGNCSLMSLLSKRWMIWVTIWASNYFIGESRRIPSSSWSKKCKKRLNGFDAKLLLLASRVTLAKLVLLAIPSYFMQTIMILIRVCDYIEQIVRKFVWGSTSSARKMTLVKWETCCKPLEPGRLGIRRMMPQNLLLLTGLAYLLVTKFNALRVWVFRSKYKMNKPCPHSIIKVNCLYVWWSLTNIWQMFQENLYWSIGDEKSINLLQDT